MSVSLQKLWNDYGVGGILIAIIGLYVVSMLYNYFMSKGSSGYEGNTQQTNSAYKNGGASPTGTQMMGPVQDSREGNNEDWSAVGGASQSMMPPASSCVSSSNPSDLLPKDTNSQWAQLNPVGQGGLANVNFLKAGYQIGIDTVGQSLRNANLQIRSEPPNPQMSVGPWNQSTITPDFLRAPLEIGQGSQ